MPSRTRARPHAWWRSAALVLSVLASAPAALAAQAPPAAPAAPVPPAGRGPVAPRPPVLRADFEPAGGATPASGALPEGPPAGWVLRPLPVGGGGGLDTTASHAGRFSLRLVQTAAGRRVAATTTRPVALSPGVVAVRMRVWLRTDGVAGRAGYGVAALGAAYAARRRPPAYVRGGDSGSVLIAAAENKTTGPGGTTPWTRYEATTPVLAGKVAALVVVLRLDGTGTAWFDDLTVEPLTAADAAAAPPSAAARAYALAALDTLRAHAMDPGQVDWSALRAFLLAGIAGARTPADTYTPLVSALKAVDPHAGLLDSAEWAALKTDSGAAPAAGAADALPAGAVLGRHGYLAVPGFTALSPGRMTRFAEAAHAAFRAQAAAGVCGYVVDLRGNTGGNAYAMFAAVAPLLYARYTAPRAAWRYADGRLTMRDGRVRVAVRRPAAARPDAPVAVLADGRTASSGEATLLHFVGRPGARTFGQPTSGLTTGNDDYRLADGVRLLIPASRMSDRRGRRYGGAVLPEEPVTPAAGDGPPPPPDQDPVVRAAAAWLDAQPACRARPGAARGRAARGASAPIE